MFISKFQGSLYIVLLHINHSITEENLLNSFLISSVYPEGIR